jgi:hypothetical protein
VRLRIVPPPPRILGVPQAGRRDRHP